jgi:hypothetical protein
MSEDTAEKVEEPKVEEPKVEEPKAEEPKAEEPKAEGKAKGKNDDIFITESDRFDILMKYYIEENEPIISGFDDDYDDAKEAQEFTITFKRPSQRDVELIMATKAIEDFNEATLVDFIEVENIRMMTLIRSWSLDRPLEDLSNIHPKIVKAIRTKISEQIGGNGIF